MDKASVKTVKDSIVTSSEVINILGITRARLSQLVKHGKLNPIKKNLFLSEDINERKEIQEELRNKYYRPKKSSK